MAATPDDLFALLAREGISFETHGHPPLFTVEDSKRLRGRIPGAHVKNLFLKDRKEGLFLISALEDTIIDLKTVHETIGGKGKVSFGSADLLRSVLGVEPGSVTPFAAMNDVDQRVRVILDARMMEHDRINVHPLVNTMTTGVGKEGLIAFLRATGHEPMIIALHAPEGGRAVAAASATSHL
jgi:Ala-tRNA(Pro) deacylase